MEEERNKKFSVMQDEEFIEFLTGKFGVIDEKFEKVDERLNKIENTMVTKEYLDRKLADLEGRLILIIKRGEARFNLLLEILLEKKVINKKDVDKIQAIEMFPVLK